MARFKAISNLVTVASDVYEVAATAQILREGEVRAEKKLRVVVER